jgi:hypothetical protein
MVVAPLIVQTFAGVDALLNENSAWIQIMSSSANVDEAELGLSASHSNAALSLIPAKASLQHLPRNKRGAGSIICNNEMDLSTFMMSAGLLTCKTSNGEVLGCYDTPRAAGSNVGSKRMLDSSPTNVSDYGERQFISRLQDMESHIPFSFEGASRVTRRKDAENQNKAKSMYCDANQVSKKRQRDSRTDIFSSPARTTQKSIGDFIFSPNRQQAASNLVDLSKGASGSK